MIRKNTLLLLLLAVLSTLLLFKLHLSLTRQFDPDELSYLHWAYLLTQGKLPYKDFFFFIAPVYPAFLTPLFLLPQGPNIALAGRLVMVVVYLLTIAVLFSLIKRTTRNTLLGLLTVLIFTAFPMTFDKTIEIRPDMMMTLLFFAGILMLPSKVINNRTGGAGRGAPTKGSPCGYSWENARDRTRLLLCSILNSAWIRSEDVGRGNTRGSNYVFLFLSGICFSLSFLVMFKIVFAIPAVIFLFIATKRTWRDMLFFSIGCIIPLLFLFLWLWNSQLVVPFFHSITYDAAIANVGNTTFSFLTTLSPFPIMYVERGGISFPWSINTLLWILAVPGLFFLWKKNPMVGTFSLLLLGGAFLLLILFPKPYVQYFIIPTIIISLGTAYLFISLHAHTILITGCSLCLLVSFLIQYQSRQAFRYQNTEQLQVLADIGNIIRPDEPVYDMVGSYVFRPDGYFICCHPYTQFAHRLQTPIPNLIDSLIATQTKFLVLDQKGYVFWITAPPDQHFLLTQYLPTRYNKIYSLGSRFLCNHGSCTQYTLHGKPIEKKSDSTFQIVIDETYRIAIDPIEQWVTVKNNTYHDGDTVDLYKGTYVFTPSFLTKSFSIQLAR